MAMENINECAQCGQKLLGRTDKRFCGDYCRNSYNRHQRQQNRIPLPPQAAAVIEIIKHNYQLIGRKESLGDDETISCDLGSLTSRGFIRDFYTSLHTDKTGNQWYCVFDWCFHISGSQVEIKDFPEVIKALQAK